MLSILKKTLKYVVYFVSCIFILIMCFIAYLIWFQPPFYFPKPNGQYAVGVKDYHWIDEKRKEIFADDPAHPNRELMIKIWYPMDGLLPEKPKVSWAPDLVDYFKKHKFIFWMTGFSRPIYSWSELEAPISSEKLTYPIVIFSHGYGGTRDTSTAHCENLASHGYIVVGISHTYDSCVVRFPNGYIADGEKSMSNRFHGSRTEIKKQDDKEVEIWVSDVKFVLDQLEKLNGNRDHNFYNKLGLEAIGIFGHSFGGSVAVQMCRRDNRIKAGVDLEGSLFGSHATEKFDKPFMIMLAGDKVKMFERKMNLDDWKKFGISSSAEEEMVRSTYLLGFKQLANQMPHNFHIFVLNGAEHMSFCDNMLLKEAVLWPNYLKNFGAGSMDGFRATEIVNAYLVSFFDKYLQGQPSELLDGSVGWKYKEVLVQ